VIALAGLILLLAIALVALALTIVTSGLALVLTPVLLVARWATGRLVARACSEEPPTTQGP
jgi:hypothetical protein